MNKIDALGLLYKKIIGKKWKKKPRTVAAAILQIQNDYTPDENLVLSDYVTKEELQKAIDDALGMAGIKLAEPSNISLTNYDEAVLIKWTDPQNIILEGAILAEWAGTVVVRKAGSVPESKIDGNIVIDSKIRNQYQNEGFLDNNLTNGVEYFYGIFPYTTKNTYTTSKIETITTEPIYPSAVTNVLVVEDDKKLKITYNSDNSINRVKCVYKENTAPENSSDGIAIDNFTSGNSITDLTNKTTYYFKLYGYNEKNRETESAIYSGTPKEPLKIVTFTNGTDEELEAMLNAHYENKINISDYWAVGDIREILLNGVSYQFSIIGFNHDNLAVPINSKIKAAVSIQMTNCLNDKYTFDDESVNAWENSTLRDIMNNEMLNWFPTTFKKLIKVVNKDNCLNDVSTQTQDCLWLTSISEVTTEYYQFVNEGKQYSYYTSFENKKKKLLDEYITWWTRSPYNANVSCIKNTGSFIVSDCTSQNGVSFGLCI